MTSEASFFEAQSGGDPAFLQHLQWFLGQPQTWLAIGAWLFFLLGGVKLGRRLWRLGKLGLLVVLIFVMLAFVGTYVWQFSQTLGLAVQGIASMDLFLPMRLMSWMVLALGFASAIWIVRDIMTKGSA